MLVFQASGPLEKVFVNSLSSEQDSSDTLQLQLSRQAREKREAILSGEDAKKRTLQVPLAKNGRFGLSQPILSQPQPPIAKWEIFTYCMNL